MSAANIRAAQRKIKIPNPLKAADDVWKAAGGKTQWPKDPSMHPPTPTTVIAGSRRPKRRGAAGYSKGSLPG